MSSQVWKIKSLTFVTILLLFGMGRWFNLSVIHKMSFEIALLNGIFYGIFIAVIFIFVVDLVLANGLLQHKIHLIEVLFMALLFTLIGENIILDHFNVSFSRVFVIKTLLSVIFFILVSVSDIRASRAEKFVFLNSTKIPAYYFRKRPIKTIFALLFRLFPHPEPVALYKIGDPQPSSPVLVTGNFELTIRRVITALKNTNCWLLVCDSRGINIWCASEADHFGTEPIINAIRLTGLSEKVNYKKLILPQLAASNVSTRTIQNETGFNAVFGPVNINSIETYFKNPDDRRIRKVTFSILERIEASFCSPMTLSVLLLFVFNFIGFSYLRTILPLVYFFNFMQAIIFPKRIIKNALSL